LRAGLRPLVRALLGALYLIAAYFHLAAPGPFLTIMPGWVPWPEATVALTGVAEGIGALMLLQPWSPGLRRAGGLGLALYAVCVFPANINHFALDMAKPDGGLGLAYHVPRMIAQPVLVWLALWTGGWRLPGTRPQVDTVGREVVGAP
jgi:uncharacterized membrane protein